MKKRHRREDMQRLFDERAKQKLTMQQLSERSGIPVPTLSYWSSKFRQEQRVGNGLPTLVEVDLVRDSASTPIRIELGSGVRVQVELGFDAAHLSRVIDVLAARC